MKTRHLRPLLAAAVSAVLLALPAQGGVFVQCPAPLLTQNATGGSCGTGPCTFNPRDPSSSTDPGCKNPDAADFATTCQVQKDPITGAPSGATSDPTVVCRSITCGDGHVNMADGSDMFVFGFHDTTNAPEQKQMSAAYWYNPSDETLTGAAEFSAPTIFAKEGQKLYVTLTNTGFRERPDLVDSHTIHFHGFPNAAPVFDGEPMASFGINMGASLTYFYDNQTPGTFMWHCHVEAAEHMQMGMLGNLFILPKQDGTSLSYGGRTYSKFAYNDCPTLATPSAPQDPMCGSTGYDVMYFLQETAFDPVFHEADHTYQVVDFAAMNDTYAMFNGRGYPDSVNPAVLENVEGAPSQPTPAVPFLVDGTGARQPLPIVHGQKLLLRVSSLSTEKYYTVRSLGIPMRVVGQGAQLRRGPTGTNTSYETTAFTLSGGESVDVLLDTTNVPPGTYFLYTTNLNDLSNDAEDFGGLMTEIIVS
jgi:FtsP/CotA-like multicopper oxidase with cupredoxin domain